MGRLLVVDLAAVFRRAWHGVDGDARAILPDGRPFHGVHGTVTLLMTAIRTYAPDHLLVASEAPGANSGRRDLDPTYKAHRPPPDSDLVGQFRDTWSVLASARWPVVGFFRKEADDVVASAVAAFPDEVVILSGDRDLLALCSERTTVALFRPGGSITVPHGPEECRKLMGVPPEQVCELKALAGDTSDGISGIAGIGPRSAQRILKHYGSLRAAFDDPLLIGVPPNVRRAFKDGHAAAQLSYRLARLDSSLPVGGSWRRIDDCFGEESVERVAALGFLETSRQFRAAPVARTPIPS